MKVFFLTTILFACYQLFLKERWPLFSTPSKQSPPQFALPQLPQIQRNPKDISQIGRPDDRQINPFYNKLSPKQRTSLAVGLVNEIYSVVLLREPSERERRGKINILQQGGAREGIYRSLVLGDEYRQQELAGGPLSERNQKFALDYFKTYLGVAVTGKQLDQWNFYGVKRLAAERALEIIDAFAERADVNAWFAILSERMEQEVKWRQKHRQLGGRQRYLQWAQKFPWISSRVKSSSKFTR